MLFDHAIRTVGVFSSLGAAGQALDRLVLEGFPLKSVFLVGNDLGDCQANSKAIRGVQLVDQKQVGTISGTTQGLTKGLVAGNILGGATGVLLGLGILALPGVGQIALTSAIVFTLLSGGICTAAGGVIGALVGLGLTENQVKQCSEQLSQGNYLLIVNGTEQEIHLAERILNPQSIRK
jgi:hypothetical protein